MHEEQYLQRAQALLDVERYEHALEELRKALGENPESAPALLLALICYTQLQRRGQAIKLAREILQQDAEEPLVYYLLALNLANDNSLSEAMEVAERGLSVAPAYADLIALLGQMKSVDKQWDAALDYANRALSIEPNHVMALNVRVAALNKLGRKEEMQSSMRETLAADPNSSYAHSNVGWAHLESREHVKAKEHFTEALRLDPNNEQARAGLLEALKAKNIIYRLFLSWMFFMSKQTEQTQWLIVIGAYFGYRYLSSAAQTYPILMPVVVFLALSFYATWMLTPLSNLLIKMDKVARYALTKEESRSANIVGAGLLLGIASFAAYWQIGGEIFSLIGFFLLSILIPITTYFRLIGTNKEQHALGAMFLLAGIGIGGIVTIVSNSSFGTMLWTTYVMLFLGYQFLANYWSMRAHSVR
ncbi:MAG: tetratricopeptide repeat protein [Aureispira sp.]